MTGTLHVQNQEFRSHFPARPFRIAHSLAADPRLTLPAILELVQQLPGDRIEYNSGKVGITQDPSTTPLVDLSPDAVIARIETAGAWMVLKRIECLPAYRALLEEGLLSVARARGHSSIMAAGFSDIQGFLFVSSPDSTTPFHVDGEDNFFVQIHGDKQFNVYDNEDRAIVSEDQIEHALTQHRNMTFDPAYEDRGMHNHLEPGDGLFIPYLWPHYVKTKGSYSISLAITWKSKAVRRRNHLYVANSMLRRRGLPQKAPGVHRVWDEVKILAMQMAAATVDPLRRSERLRKAIRGLILGKGANYYYRDRGPEAGKV
ncbi:cupin-like domain-containing protein [Pararhizobium haloflavum]|uniref:cupin-like domain-containing protein n=1 Tax=Pararhizobium haloflavum TaxID=2037914 RepID=UPI000C19D0AB|nr:cupin-like domain-containing protein [Pararhizobium haloflavum]